MVLDEGLLESARRAASEVADRRRDLEVAEATHAHAVRRLHASGGSLSEIAQALGLSRQRIHQIVKASGGVPGRRRRRPGPQLVCSFCDRDHDNVAKLIAGPNVYICDDCVADARERLATGGDRGARCSFCGKTAAEGGGLADRDGAAPRVCAECLDLCDEIIAEEAPA